MTNKKKQMDIPDKSNSQKKPIPYQKRSDLTADEKDAIGHYRDLNYQQFDWSYKPEKKRLSSDCDIINGVLRKNISISKLNSKEQTRFKQLVSHISSAVFKSKLSKGFTVYKGLIDFDGLKDYQIGKIVEDKAFGSFSTSKEVALKYAGPNSKGELIIFILDLNRSDYAIYIDEKESEWVLPRNSKYYVADISHYEKSEWGDSKAIIYYLRLA